MRHTTDPLDPAIGPRDEAEMSAHSVAEPSQGSRPDAPLAGPDAHAHSTAATWSKPVERLAVGAVPSSAINLNVAGRRLVGPVQGFGRLWQKRYRIRLSGADVTPQQVIAAWKTEFASF